MKILEPKPLIITICCHDNISLNTAQIRLKANQAKSLERKSLLGILQHFLNNLLRKSSEGTKIANIIKSDPLYTIFSAGILYEIKDSIDGRLTPISDVVVKGISEDYEEYYKLDLTIFDHRELFRAFDFFEMGNPFEYYKPCYVDNKEYQLEAYSLFEKWFNYILISSLWMIEACTVFDSIESKEQLTTTVKDIKTRFVEMTFPDSFGETQKNIFEDRKDASGHSIMDVVREATIYGSDFSSEEADLFQYGYVDGLLNSSFSKKILFQLALKYTIKHSAHNWSPAESNYSYTLNNDDQNIFKIRPNKYYINKTQYNYKEYFSIVKEALNFLNMLFTSEELFNSSGIKASTDDIWPIECIRDGSMAYQQKIMTEIWQTLLSAIMTRMNKAIQSKQIKLDTRYLSSLKKYLV